MLSHRRRTASAHAIGPLLRCGLPIQGPCDGTATRSDLAQTGSRSHNHARYQATFAVGVGQRQIELADDLGDRAVTHQAHPDREPDYAIGRQLESDFDFAQDRRSVILLLRLSTSAKPFRNSEAVSNGCAS